MVAVYKILQSTVLLTIAQLTQRFGTVVLTFLISRWLGSAELGIYAGATAAYALFLPMCTLGAKSYLVREVATQPQQTNRYLSHIAVVGITLALLLTLCVWGVLPWLGLSIDQTVGIVITLIALVPAVLNTFLYSIFVAREQVKFITYAQFVLTICQISVSVGLLLAGYGAVSTLVALVAAEWAVLAASLWFYERSIARLRFEFDRTFLSKLLYEVRVFALLSVLAGLFAQPEVLLLTLMRSESETGIFTAAYKLINLWLIVPHVVMTSLYPMLSRAYHSSQAPSHQLEQLALKYLALICLPVAFGMLSAAEPIITLFYGDGYEDAIRPLQIMALLVPFNALIDVCWRVLAARHQQHLDLRVRLITVTLRLLIGAIHISMWGVVGAAWAALIGIVVTMIMMVWHVGQSAEALPIAQTSARTAIAALGMGLVVWFASALVPLLPLIAIAALLYAGLLVISGAIAAEDVAAWKKLARSRVEAT